MKNLLKIFLLSQLLVFSQNVFSGPKRVYHYKDAVVEGEFVKVGVEEKFKISKLVYSDGNDISVTLELEDNLYDIKATNAVESTMVTVQPADPFYLTDEPGDIDNIVAKLKEYLPMKSYLPIQKWIRDVNNYDDKMKEYGTKEIKIIDAKMLLDGGLLVAGLELQDYDRIMPSARALYFLRNKLKPYQKKILDEIIKDPSMRRYYVRNYFKKGSGQLLNVQKSEEKLLGEPELFLEANEARDLIFARIIEASVDGVNEYSKDLPVIDDKDVFDFLANNGGAEWLQWRISSAKDEKDIKTLRTAELVMYVLMNDVNLYRTIARSNLNGDYVFLTLKYYAEKVKTTLDRLDPKREDIRERFNEEIRRYNEVK